MTDSPRARQQIAADWRRPRGRPPADAAVRGGGAVAHPRRQAGAQLIAFGLHGHSRYARVAPDKPMANLL